MNKRAQGKNETKYINEDKTGINIKWVVFKTIMGVDNDVRI